jgi:hypothetical protein
MKNKKIICGIIIAILIAVIIIGIIAIKNNKKLLSKKNETNTKETTIAKATEHEIYQTVRSENNWAIDPRDPKNLLKLDGILLKIKVKSIGDAVFLPKTSEMNDPYRPYTPVKVEIIQNLSGKDINIKDNTLYMCGGDIKLSEYEKSIDNVDKQRLGIDKLSNTEKENKYMRIQMEYSYDLKENNEYIVIINSIGDGRYQIVNGGYGIFTIEQSTLNLKNVLTNKTFKINDLLNK